MNKQDLSKFRNEVFCRRESNQHVAGKLWLEIKRFVPAKVASEFETEWDHYRLSHIDRDTFAKYVDSVCPRSSVD